MCLFAIGQLLVMSSVMALAADLVPPKNRGKVVGFRNFVGYIVMGFGMLLGNYLYISSIPQMPFYLTLGLIAVGLPVAIFLIHEPERRVDEPN